MKRIKSFYISLATLILTNTQGLQAQTVDFMTDGKLFRIDEQITQSEKKPGWRIVDIQMKSTIQRYMWGAHSKQLVDSNRPQFVVNTDSLLLCDMVLIKMKEKREYRKIPQAEINDNACIYVDFNNFDIQSYGDESFLICPLKALESGEYIFTWTTTPKVGELEDWKVWPFSVE